MLLKCSREPDPVRKISILVFNLFLSTIYSYTFELKNGFVYLFCNVYLLELCMRFLMSFCNLGMMVVLFLCVYAVLDVLWEQWVILEKYIFLNVAKHTSSHALNTQTRNKSLWITHGVPFNLQNSANVGIFLTLSLPFHAFHPSTQPSTPNSKKTNFY